MPWHRTSVLVLTGLLASASWLQAVDVWTVGVNNTRQGWNKFETVLTAANVPKLKRSTSHRWSSATSSMCSR